MTALQRASRTLPIVFVAVSDPVGAGLVARLDRPGGSTTGFMIFEYSLSGKWVELLKQVAPNVTRAAVISECRQPSWHSSVRRHPDHSIVAWRRCEPD